MVSGFAECTQKQSEKRGDKMSYIPSDDDEYRQKDEVPSRWRRLLHKFAYKLYYKLVYSQLTLNYFQLVSLLLFTGVLSSIFTYLFITQNLAYLYP